MCMNEASAQSPRILEAQAALWDLMEDLVTKPTSLSLTEFLRTLHGSVGCDFMLLIAKPLDGKSSKEPIWTLIRHVKSSDRKLELRRLSKKKLFLDLLNQLLKRAMAEPPNVYADWQPPLRPDHQAAPISGAAVPDLAVGGRRVGPIAVLPLGNVAIGEWRLGESVLVMGNEFTQEDEELGGCRSFDYNGLRMGFTTFCVYLSEVNAHF